MLGECPARSARVACRDRPAMIAYQKALLMCDGLGVYCRDLGKDSPDTSARSSWSSCCFRCPDEVRMRRVLAAVDVGDVRFAAVILGDPGHEVR